MSVFSKRPSLRATVRALCALAVAVPLALTASAAFADSFGFFYGSGPHYYRPYHRHFYHPHRVVVVAPPPVYYYPPPPPRTVVVQPPAYNQSCTTGDWRQADGSIVHGVACLQPNGTWTLQ
jgi:hypothetical protein